MAAILGQTGTITFADATDLGAGAPGVHRLLSSKWNASIDREMHDLTPFAPTSAARLSIGGLHKMTGTIEGFLDATVKHDLTHMTAGVAAAAFVLTASTDITYSFNGWLSNWSVNVDVGVPNTFSCSFESSGAITLGQPA